MTLIVAETPTSTPIFFASQISKSQEIDTGCLLLVSPWGEPLLRIHPQNKGETWGDQDPPPNQTLIAEWFERNAWGSPTTEQGAADLNPAIEPLSYVWNRDAGCLALHDGHSGVLVADVLSPEIQRIVAQRFSPHLRQGVAAYLVMEVAASHLPVFSYYFNDGADAEAFREQARGRTTDPLFIGAQLFPWQQHAELASLMVAASQADKNAIWV